MPLFDKLKNAVDRFSSKPSDQKPDKVTVDTIISAIDDCKASLEKSKLPSEDIARFSEILSLMQKALRGLHPEKGIDISDLLDAMDVVFRSSMGLIFSFGTTEDCSSAINTVNDAIKTIAASRQDEVLIAALKLSILTYEALILQQQRMIGRYQDEIKKYQKEQLDLLATSGVKGAAQLSPYDANLFQQIDQRVQKRNGFISAAQMNITSYNQEIVGFEGSIENISINPRGYQTADMKARLSALRAKAPSGAELASMIEEAAKSAAALVAETEAEIKLLRTTIEENLPIVTPQTQKKIDELFDQLYNPAKTQEATEQTETTPETLTM